MRGGGASFNLFYYRFLCRFLKIPGGPSRLIYAALCGSWEKPASLLPGTGLLPAGEATWKNKTWNQSPKPPSHPCAGAVWLRTGHVPTLWWGVVYGEESLEPG